MSRYLKLLIYGFALLLSIFLASCSSNDTLTVKIGENLVKAPLVIDVSHAIAGADIAFEYSSGLTFIEYEQSATVQSALLTPVVEKDGATHLGFFKEANEYTPQDSKLDIGYLVFEYTGKDAQIVTLTEVKLVEVIDKDTTSSEIIEGIKIKIGREGGVSPIIWIAVAIVIILLGTVGVIIKNKKSKQPVADI